MRTKQTDLSTAHYETFISLWRTSAAISVSNWNCAPVTSFHNPKWRWDLRSFRRVSSYFWSPQQRSLQDEIACLCNEISYSISVNALPNPALNVQSTDTLRVTFTVADKSSGKGVQPHQTFIRFYDPKTHEEGIHPIRVASNGKAKFDLVRRITYCLFPVMFILLTVWI